MTSLLLAAVLVNPSSILVNGNLAQGLQGWAATPKAEVVSVSGQAFTQAIRFDVQPSAANQPWSYELKQLLNQPLKKGDWVQGEVWLRGDPSTRAAVVLQESGGSFISIGRREIDLTDGWQKVSIGGNVPRSYGPGETQFAIHMGYRSGKVDIGPATVSLRPAPADLSLSPVTLFGEKGELKAHQCTLEPIPGGVRYRGKGDVRMWDHQAIAEIASPLSVQNTTLIQFQARSPESQRINVVLELNREPWTKELTRLVILGPEWKTYRLAVRMGRDYAANEAAVKFQTGLVNGSAEIRNVSISNVGGAPLEKLQLTKIFEPPTSDEWIPAAQARIERIRKGDWSIEVVDSTGKAVPGAVVELEQTRHAFRFGTAVPASRILGTTPDDEKFRALLKQNFNTLTLENDLKWNSLDGKIPDEARRATAWMRANGFRSRGHNAVWGSQQYLPVSLELPAEELWRLVQQRIREAIPAFGTELYVWDVVNEAVTETGLWDKIGWDKYPEVYRMARRLNPGVKLAYNDFDNIEIAQSTPQRLQQFYGRVQQLLDAGAPLDIIGLQGHFYRPKTEPAKVLQILDEMQEKFKLPIEITELDFGSDDDAEQADYLVDLVTAFFSHPSVEAIILWGFYEGNHWRTDGAHLLQRGFQPRPAWNQFTQLLQQKWKTRVKGETSQEGLIRHRAFFGDYTVRVRHQGRTITVDASLTRGGPSKLKVVLP